MDYGQRSVAIRRALADPHTVAEVAALLGWEPSRVKGLVSHLMAGGLVSKVGAKRMESGQTAGIYQAVR